MVLSVVGSTSVGADWQLPEVRWNGFVWLCDSDTGDVSLANQKAAEVVCGWSSGVDYDMCAIDVRITGEPHVEAGRFAAGGHVSWREAAGADRA